MSLTSFSFIVFAVLSVILLRTVPGGLWRQGTLLCLDGVFLYSQTGALLPLMPLICFVLLGYVAVIAAQTWKTRYSLGLLIVGLVAVFVWLKRYPIASALPPLGFTFTVVGLSYILFRILHIVIDVGQGSLERPRFLTYLNYTCNFLCLLSGPIARVEEFGPQAQVRPPLPTWLEVDAAAQRIVRGYVMVIVLAGITTNFVELLKPELSTALAQGVVLHGIRVYALLTATYLVNLYLNFCGYMEIVLGIGTLAGLRLPENFNFPFLSKNFLDLWSRWHITLSNWLKLYLFNAVLKALGARFGTATNMVYLGVVAFFVTFLVMGIWHGTTYVYFAYGLYLGAGVTANRLWQIWAPKWLGKARWKSLQQQRWYFEMSRAAALGYLALALSSFWISDDQAAALLRPEGLAVFVGAYGVLVVGGTVAGFVWDAMLTGIVGVTLVSVVGAVASLEFAGVLAASSTARKVTVCGLLAGSIVAILVSLGHLEPAVARWRDATFPRRGGDAAAVWLGFRALIAVNLCLLMATSIPEFIYKAF